MTLLKKKTSKNCVWDKFENYAKNRESDRKFT